MEEFKETFDDLLQEAEQKESSIKKYLDKTAVFFKDKKNTAITVLSVILVANSVYITKIENNKEINQFIQKEPVSQSLKLKDGLFCTNLNKYEITNSSPRSIKNLEGKVLAEKFRVWYRKTSKDSINDSKFYITIEENINKLKYNKKSFANYIEDESNK